MKRLLILFIFLSYTIIINAQLDPLFGVNGRSILDIDSLDNYPQFVRPTLDNGFIVCVFTSTSDLKHNLIKYDAEGHIDSNFANGLFYYQRVPGISSESYFDIAPLKDSGFLLFGASTTSSINTQQLVLKLDQYGDVDASYNIDGKVLFQLPGGRVYPRVAFLDTSGNYLEAGEIPISISNTELYITRHLSDGFIDSSFNSIGYLTLNPPDSAFHPIQLMRINPNQYELVGRTENTFPQKILYIRFNNDGTLDNSFGVNGTKLITTLPNFLPGVALQFQQSIYLGGMYTNSSGVSKACMVKTDVDGNLDLSFASNGIDTSFLLPDSMSIISDLNLVNDNQIMISGYLLTSLSKLFVSQKDLNGNFNTIFGLNGTVLLNTDSSLNDFGGHACVLKEGNLVCAGNYSKINANTQQDLSLCKLIPQAPLKIDDLILANENILFPNPASSYFYVNQLEQNSTLEVIDLNGAVRLNQTNKHSPSIKIDIQHLSDGIYFCAIRHHDHPTKVLKFIVNHQLH